MNNTIQPTKQDVLSHYISKGARKGELYDFFKPHSRRTIYAEILDILTTERDIKKPEADRVLTLKGSEVALLYDRLG